MSGPPYDLPTAGLGGMPVPGVDDPVCGVLIVLFILSAATNMTILRINLARGHKFLMSGMVFGFSMARITALVIRIVWASRQSNIRIAIAAQILTVAGVILLFLINLIFAQRVLRAHRPAVGWSRPATFAFRFLFASVPGSLAMVIPATISSFYTLSPRVRGMDHRVQLVATTWMAFLAFAPIPITLLALFAPPPDARHNPEPFGRGTMRTKVALLLSTSALLTLGAGFRAGVNYEVRPRDDPAWFHSRPCYYIFNFAIEIVVVYTYTLARFDLRFHVPNGSSAPGHYAAGGLVANKSSNKGSDTDADPEKSASENDTDTADGAVLERRPSLADRVNNEEDVFGSDTEPSQAEQAEQADESRPPPRP